MKTTRKAISKKLRFEIFKRDNFTCQYCGSKSPDVVLQVDHINPVHNGGENDILNLVTSCFDCNIGKKHRLLCDRTVIEKREKQVNYLKDNKKVIDKIIQQRNTSENLTNYPFKKSLEYYNSKFYREKLDYVGRCKLEKLTKKYGVEKVMDNIDDCFSKFYGIDEFAKCRLLIDKIESKFKYEKLPLIDQRISYLRGILLNKSRCFKIKNYTLIMSQFKKQDFDIEVLIKRAKDNEFNDFKIFENEMYSVLAIEAPIYKSTYSFD